MDDQLTDAEKARLVWEVACIPGAEPLDDRAAALGDDLSWAAQFRAIADSPLPPRERKRLKSIELTAGKLEHLLDECHATRDWIERCSVDLSPDGSRIETQGLRRELAALRDTAKFLQGCKGAPRFLVEKAGSAERLFVREAARIYVEYTKRKAAISRSKDQKTLIGPFVRFVQEASQQFCEGAPPPSPETIKKALAEPRRAGLDGARGVRTGTWVRRVLK
jgi:hypothetical protein